jgi:tetratricopeptide (TPR) repeat protein
VLWIAKNERHDIIKLALLKHFKELKQKYEVEDSLDNSHESPLYLVLKKLDQEQRLDPTEIAYLQDKNWFYAGTKIYICYHTIQATFYEADYQKTGNKWNIPNISSHWRKAEQTKKALKSTDNIDLDKIKEGKLKSAILTTRGGAFRDIEQLDEAEKCARQAITFQPSSHHPYTLMGAICYDRYQRSEGDEWFEKAIERGASRESIDSEIKKSLARMKDKNKREQMSRDLLKKDSRRYSWASKFLSKNSR